MSLSHIGLEWFLLSALIVMRQCATQGFVTVTCQTAQGLTDILRIAVVIRVVKTVPWFWACMSRVKNLDIKTSQVICWISFHILNRSPLRTAKRWGSVSRNLVCLLGTVCLELFFYENLSLRTDSGQTNRVSVQYWFVRYARARSWKWDVLQKRSDMVQFLSVHRCSSHTRALRRNMQSGLLALRFHSNTTRITNYDIRRTGLKSTQRRNGPWARMLKRKNLREMMKSSILMQNLRNFILRWRPLEVWALRRLSWRFVYSFSMIAIQTTYDDFSGATGLEEEVG